MSESEYGRGFARDIEKINETVLLQYQTGIQVFYGDELRKAYRKAGMPLGVELPEKKEVRFAFEEEDLGEEDNYEEDDDA